MSTKRNVLLERFYNALISGDRATARAIVDECFEADIPAERVIANLFWPTLEHIQNLFRAHQLTNIAHGFATRLLRMLVDQMQMRLPQAERTGKRILLTCGPEEPEELSGQMTADLLEAAGHDIFFAGGGIANDEIVEQLGSANIDVLVVFGATPSTIPFTRQLIDRLHEIGSAPKLQIAVGGGIFNRAEGLAEEIGADIWAHDPQELVERIAEEPHRRMTADQRTVGRKRRPTPVKAANAA